MKPSMFLSLAKDAPQKELQSETVKNHLKSGGQIASPFLEIQVPQEWFEDEIGPPAQIVAHEGRKRMVAVKQLFGDERIQVHLFFRHTKAKKT